MRLICIQLLVKNQQVMQVDNDKRNCFQMPNAWSNQKKTLRDQRGNRNGDTEDSKFTAIWKQHTHIINHYIKLNIKIIASFLLNWKSWSLIKHLELNWHWPPSTAHSSQPQLDSMWETSYWIFLQCYICSVGSCRGQADAFLMFCGCSPQTLFPASTT